MFKQFAGLLLIALVLGIGAAKIYRIYTDMQEIGIVEAAPQSLMILDKAKILDEAAKQQIHQYHKHLLKAHDIDYRVMTTPNAGDINILAAQMFKEMKVGSLSKTGKGFLFILDPGHDLTRLEVSANLEGVYTDAFVSYVQRNWTVQYFKGNQIKAGILAMTELFITRAQEAERGQAFDPANLGAGKTTGAGAATQARLGQGYESDQIQANTQDVIPASQNLSPLEVYNALIKSYMAGITAIDPDMFTAESRKLFAHSTPSAAQNKNMGKKYSFCMIHSVKENGDYAVVSLALEGSGRECGPMFFKKEDGKWKFDVPGIAYMIIYDFENRWMLRNDPRNPYMFAFQDWNFRSGKGSGGTPMLWPLKEGQ